MNTELEQKRLAVLASLKKNRSQSQSPSLIAAQVNINKVSKQAKIIQNELSVAPNMETLLDAVLDLRSLGYSFEQIVSQCGVSSRFLELCYSHWGFPIVKPVVKAVVTPTTVSISDVPIAVSKNEPQNNRYNVPAPVANSRPRFSSNKYVRDQEQQERPEWLNNLVFTLDTTDEEESDEDTQEESENTFTVDVVLPAQSDYENSGSDKIDFLNNSTKKRKSETQEPLTLEDILLKKKTLNLKANLLSDKIKLFEHEAKTYDNEIKQKDKSIPKLEAQISQIEKTLERLKEKLSSDIALKSQLESERKEYHSLKESLANSLIEIDFLEQQELKFQQAQKKMRKSSQSKTVTTNTSISNDPPVKNPDVVSDETIHKIPKVI